jgi:hypothetical protein
LYQHPVDPEVSRRAELIDADVHAFMAVPRMGSVGSQQAVPPRLVEAEIAIGLVRVDGMVDTAISKRLEPSKKTPLALYYDVKHQPSPKS